MREDRSGTIGEEGGREGGREENAIANENSVLGKAVG
jgi:hypothetical protein